MNELRVYGHYVSRPGAKISEICRRHAIDPSEPLLLVMATTRGPVVFANTIAAAGSRPVSVDKHGKFEKIVDIRTDSLVAFAAQHPDTLLATSASGQPPEKHPDGSRLRVWADLSETRTQTTQSTTTQAATAG